MSGHRAPPGPVGRRLLKASDGPVGGCISCGITCPPINYIGAFWEILQPVWKSRRYDEFTGHHNLVLPLQEGFPGRGFSTHHLSSMIGTDTRYSKMLRYKRLREGLDAVWCAHYDLNTAVINENERAFKRALHDLFQGIVELKKVVLYVHRCDPALAPRVYRACVEKIEVLHDVLRKMPEACGYADWEYRVKINNYIQSWSNGADSL